MYSAVDAERGLGAKDIKQSVILKPIYVVIDL